jgi:hypothetical protein
MKTRMFLPCTSRKVVIALSCIIVIAGLFVVPGCARYRVNGTLAIKNIDCDGVIPPKVKVYAQVFNSQNSSGASGTFNANGPFNLSIVWNKALGAPTAWKVTKVIRPDGKNVCKHPDMKCAESERCLNMATNVRQAPIAPVEWTICS